MYVLDSENRYINDINDAVDRTLTQVEENTIIIIDAKSHKHKITFE